MSKIKLKKRIKFLFIITIVLLLCSMFYLEFKNTSLEHSLKELEIKKENMSAQEEFVKKHKSDLDTIKSLKQEILGQEDKLQELTGQVQKFTEILIENQKKLDEMES